MMLSIVSAMCVIYQNTLKSGTILILASLPFLRMGCNIYVRIIQLDGDEQEKYYWEYLSYEVKQPKHN